MIYEIDTVFDAVVTVSAMDENGYEISNREIQDMYNNIYTASSKQELVNNIKSDVEKFLDINKGSGWSQWFLNTTNWNYIKVNVELLKEPDEYENEIESEIMDNEIKRAYRYCKNDMLDVEIYTCYFNVYYSGVKYRVEKYGGGFIRIDRIIKECFPYHAEVTYVESAKEVSGIIRDFKSWVNKNN